MNILIYSKYCLLLATITVMLSSCGGVKIEPREPIGEVVPNYQKVNESNIDQVVNQYPGFAVVLFYNSQYWESNDMKKRMDLFSHIYGQDVRFCDYHWDMNNDGSKYKLELLPTVVLYKHGNEIDRIKGIPGNEQDRMKWNKDIDLWFLKNAKGAKGNEHSGAYSYRFNNGSQLEINNF